MWSAGTPVRRSSVDLEGIAWRFRTGAPWRDLPADFGPWQTVWKRHHRFSFDGTYQRIFDELRQHWADDELDDGMARLLSIDSTVVRAHQHAAGAPAAEDTGAERIQEFGDRRARRPRAGPLPGWINHQDPCLDRYRDLPGRDDAHAWAGWRQSGVVAAGRRLFGAEATADASVMCGCWPIRRTRIPPPAPHCGSAGSSTRSPNATIRSLVARPRAPPVVDHRPSTAKSTSSATPLNAAQPAQTMARHRHPL